MSDAGKGRIAIKFGSGSSSSKPNRPNPPSSLGKRPRSHVWGGGPGSDSEQEGDDDDDKASRRNGGHEAITGFGAEGAETERKSKDARTEKKEYVIARQPNRDWKADVKSQRRGGKNLLPPEARARQNGDGDSAADTEPADQDKGIKWGLTVKEKTDRSTHDAEDSDTSRAKGEPDDETRPKEDKDTATAERTVDEQAMDALLGREPAKGPAAVIHPTETDAYQRDMQAAGEASTLDDYEAMPVEEFGAALLRGMGWDGKDRGPKTKEVKRRPNRMGLGAKELKGDEELGGWGQKGGKKKSRPRLDEYRREESRRKESRRERERDRDREWDSRRGGGSGRDRDGDRDGGRDYDRHRDRDRGYDRDRRR